MTQISSSDNQIHGDTISRTDHSRSLCQEQVGAVFALWVRAKILWGVQNQRGISVGYLVGMLGRNKPCWARNGSFINI